MNKQRGIKILAGIFVFLLALSWKPAEAFAYVGNGNGKVVKVAYYEAGNMMKGASEEEHKSGYAFDYLQQVAYITGWKYEYVYGTFDDLYNQFLNGEIDVFPYLSYSEERSSKMLYPNREMGEETFYLSVLEENKDKYVGSTISLQGTSIGVEEGVYQNNLLLDFLDTYKINAKVVNFKTSEECSQALRDGIIEISFDASVLSPADFVLIRKIGGQPFFCCVSKDRQDLMMELNMALNDLAEVNPYFLEKLEEMYFTDNAVRRTISSEESFWIKNHGIIRAGSFSNDAPFSYMDAEGKVVGVFPAMVEEFLNKLHLNVPVQWKLYNTSQELREALKNGEIDIIVPEYYSFSYAEENNLLISDKAFSASMSILYIGNKSANDLKAIATTDSRPALYFVKDNFPDVKIIPCDTVDECIKKVISGEADGAISHTSILEQRSSLYDVSNMTLNLINMPCDICIACRSTESSLVKLLNRGLPLISEAEINYFMVTYNDISDKPVTLYDFMKMHPTYLLILICVLSALVLFILFLIFKARITRQKEQMLISILSGDFEVVEHMLFSGDTSKDEAAIVRCSASFDQMLPEFKNVHLFRKQLDLLIENMVEEDKERFYAEAKRDAVVRVLSKEQAYFIDFRMDTGEKISNFQIKFAGYYENEALTGVVIGIHNVDKELEKEYARQEELRDARTKAEAANAAKTAFLFNMSHDIRTPMNAILGYASVASKNCDNTERVKDCLEKIKFSGSHLVRLINEVLDMSQIESGKVEINETVSDIIDGACTTMCADLAKRKSINLNYTPIDIKTRYVYYDTLHVNQIFMNILSNAIKYTEPGGTVNFTVEQTLWDIENRKAEFKFTIEDNGIGMSEEYVEHIFEAFSREKNSTKNVIEGSGLGMSIVKKMVDILNGKITVESKKNVGTKVIVTLPFRVADEQKMMEEEGTIDAELLKGKKVLVVEDNEMNLEIVTELLQDNNLCVETAEDGDIAVEMISSKGYSYYDFVLMDVQMPRMNGYEATREIRKLSHGENEKLPIIAVTANAFEEDRRNALEAGMDDHVAKPIDMNKLLKTLNRLL